MLRRKRYTVAVYGMILAASQLVLWLVDSGHPLEQLSFHYQDLDVLLLIALTASRVLDDACEFANAIVQ